MPVSVFPLIIAGLIGLASVLISNLIPVVIRRIKLARIPLFGKEPGEWFDYKAKQRLLRDPIGLLKQGLEKYPGGFQIVGEFSRQIIIPPQYSSVVNADSRFSTTEPLEAFLKFDLPGVEGLHEIHAANHDLFVNMLRSKLTQHSAFLNEALMEEAATAFDENWGTSQEWHEIDLRSTIVSTVSRLSTRIFLGPELCTNPNWLRIISDYVLNVFNCARSLRVIPGPLAKIYQRYSREGRDLRAQVAEARALLQPFIDGRIRTAQLAKRDLAEMPQDAATWLHEAADGRAYDAVAMQLGISAVAIHTTTDLLSQTILDLVTHPDMIEALRKEIDEVSQFDAKWWTRKNALQDLRLLDSVIKETQRVKPVGGATTQRYAQADFALPNGLVIPAGSMTLSSMSRMWDATYYPNPSTWDGYRFYNLRKSPNASTARSAQLVATSTEHLGFGQGLHACPGRFFAAAELKVALAHLLMNYHFEGIGGKDIAKPMICGLGEFVSNPVAKVRVRKRRCLTKSL